MTDRPTGATCTREREARLITLSRVVDRPQVLSVAPHLYIQYVLESGGQANVLSCMTDKERAIIPLCGEKMCILRNDTVLESEDKTTFVADDGKGVGII